MEGVHRITVSRTLNAHAAMVPGIDRLLDERERQGRPVRVGMAGAGVMARTLAVHLLTPVPGLRLCAVANRTLEAAHRVFTAAGARPETATTPEAIDALVERGVPAVTDDPAALAAAGTIDLIIEATGTVEYACHTALQTISRRKHLVLVNAELDSTLGPLLKRKGDEAGVVVTNVDGDEPGVAMNLVRYLRSIGLHPVAAGNLKGMLDPYRTPETQREFAARYGQNPFIVTSFADGTKLAMEAAILANATGFRVGRRGMYGPRCTHIKEMSGLLPLEQVLDGGLVDYALGAEPGTGAFVLVHEENPAKRSTLSYLKMGEGPLYTFYTPYHLPHLQIVSTIARAALAGDATTAPLGAPVCDVIAVAKRDLRAGETLDGVGGFTTYGMIDNAPVVAREHLLPVGLSAGCILRRAVRKDEPIGTGDVELPSGRLCDALRSEQETIFRGDRR